MTGFCGLQPRYDCTIGIYDVPCMVCFLHGSSLNEVMVRQCCQGTVCRGCLSRHFEEKINQAIVKIVCPLENCEAMANEDEIKAILKTDIFEKYQKFKVDLEANPHVKTCPNCSRVYRYEITPSRAQNCDSKEEKIAKPRDEGKRNVSSSAEDIKLKVTCPACNLVWCFSCHAPWHYGIACKDFCKGDKSLKIWAKNHGQAIRNARRCPKCRIYIQKYAGCDHMTCSRCKTEFCYRCGCRFRSCKFLGDHYDRLSIFGCKYNFRPDKPAQRVATRYAILSGALLAAPVVVGVAAGVGCAVIGVGVIAVPVYGSYRLLKKKYKK